MTSFDAKTAHLRASASVPPASPPAAQPATRPIVLIDGAPEPRLAVRELAVQGPLDERQVQLAVPVDVTPSQLQRWLGAEAMVGWPMRLADGSLRWPVLAGGRLSRASRAVRAGSRFAAQRGLTVVDTWTDRLAQRLGTVWWTSSDGALAARAEGMLTAGPRGNRSSQTFAIHGKPVHVPQYDGGASWTVATALATLAAFARLDLSLALLPKAVADAPLIGDVDLGSPIGEALRAILRPYDLLVQRDMHRAGATLLERKAVRPRRHGRPVRLRWPGKAAGLSDALRIDIAHPAPAAQRWVARAIGWQIESTFDLVGGWDPNLEGAPDSD